MDLEIRNMRLCVKEMKNSFLSTVKEKTKTAVENFKAKRKRGANNDVSVLPKIRWNLRSRKNVTQSTKSATGKMRVYSCPKCDKTASSQSEIEFHQKLHSHVGNPLRRKLRTRYDAQELLRRRRERDRERKWIRRQKTYNCTICPEVFHDLRLFNIHLRTHDESAIEFCCPLCDKKYNSASSLFVHQGWHTSVDGFKCRVCNGHFENIDYLNLHYYKSHVEPFNETAIRILKTCMTNSRRRVKYKCEHCPLKFYNSKVFNSHNLSHEQITPCTFSCPLCKDKSFDTLGSLFTHQNWHPTMSECKCSTCEVNFDSLDNLTVHYHREHLNIPENNLKYLETHVSRRSRHKNLSRRVSYNCQHCSDVFHNSKAFKFHVAMHETEGNAKEPTDLFLFSCPICTSKNFSSLISLFIHQTVHSKECEFNCTTCREKFDKLDDLTLHYYKNHVSTPEKHFQSLEEAIATKQKELASRTLKKNKCVFCFQQFSHSRLLTTHFGEHIEEFCNSSELRFNCLICNLEFTSVKQLTTHISSHEKPLSFCNVCNKMFENMKVLMVHHYGSHFEYVEPVVKFIVDDVTRRIVQHLHRKRSRRESKQFTSGIQKKVFKPTYSKEDSDETYVCVICDEEFDTKVGLRTHFEHHTGSELAAVKQKGLQGNEIAAVEVNITKNATHVCEVCTEVFFSIYKYRKHLISAHSEKKDVLKRVCYSCPICDEVVPTSMMFLSHLKYFHEVFAQCPICKLTFDTQETFTSHAEENHPACTRKGEKFMKCPEGYFCKLCGMTSKTYNSIESHFELCHTEKSFQCEFCPMKFSTEQRLTSHVQGVHQEKPFCCDQCGKRFHRTHILRAHKKNAHSDNKEKRVKCSQCDQSFSGLASYRVHFTAFHTTKKPFQCGVCGRTFAVQSSYHIHKTTVCEKEKAKVATCTICQTTFPNYIILHYHKSNIHKFGNKEETVCHLCNRTCKNSGALYSHNNIYHRGNTKPVDCEDCGKQLPNQTLLFWHWVTHFKDKPFQCEACGAQFKQKSGFTFHNKRKHDKSKSVHCITDAVLLKSMQERFQEAHKDQLANIRAVGRSISKEKTPTPEEDALVTMMDIQSDNLQFDSFMDDNGSQGQLSDVEELLNNLDNNASSVTDIVVDLPATSIAPNYPTLTYVDFSRANIKERLLEPEMPSDEIASAKNDGIEIPLLVLKSVLTEESCTGEPSIDPTFLEIVPNDNVPDTNEGFEDLEPPPSVYYDDGVSEEDIKPILDTENPFPEDPFAEQLVVMLEKLPNYSCSVCNYVCHTAKQSRMHRNTRSHRTAAKKHHAENLHVLKDQKQDISSVKEETKLKNKSKIKITNKFRKKSNIVVKKEPCLKRESKTRGLRSPICKKEVPDQNSLEEHTISHAKKVCSICFKKFSSGQKLANHYIEDHDGEKITKCDICGKGFLRKSSLLRHKDRAHGIPYIRLAVGRPKSAKKAEEAKETTKCEICGKIMSKKSSLKRHKDVIHGIPYVHLPVGRPKTSLSQGNHKSENDDLCEIPSVVEEELEKSEDPIQDAIKRGEKRHENPIKVIERRNKDSKQPEGKQISAENVRMYTCSICGEKIHNLNAYQNHVEAHRIEKFKCILCDEPFDLLDSLTTHCTETHGGVMPFQCDKCSKGYVTMPLLERHKKLFHKEEMVRTIDNVEKHKKLFHKENTVGTIDNVNPKPENRTPPKEKKTENQSQSEFIRGEHVESEEKVFTSLKSHRKVHTASDKSFPCVTCHNKMSYSSEEKLQKHIAKYHQEGRMYDCEFCGKSFQNVYAVNQHRRVHFNDKAYCCDNCEESFDSLELLYHHNRQSHADMQQEVSNRNYRRKIRRATQEFICEMCGKVLTSQENLDSHRRIHTGERPFICSQCGEAFISRRTLHKHNEIKHEEKTHLCRLCGKYFKQAGDLAAHKRIHSGDRPYPCSMCDRVFITSKNRRMHIQADHLGQRHPCDICGKEFKKTHDLKMHVRTHTGERPYKCKFCDATFASNGNRVKHVRIHHLRVIPVKGSTPAPYLSCSVCPLQFRSQQSFNKHMELHDSSRPHACHLCPSFFNHRSNLEFHKKNVHEKMGILYKKKSRKTTKVSEN